MTAPPSYRFKFQIVDETSGDVVESDFCGLLPETIDQFGGCESVNIHVAAMLRAFKRIGREEYERREYWRYCDFCGDKFERVFKVTVDDTETNGCADCATRETEIEREANSQFGVGA